MVQYIAFPVLVQPVISGMVSPKCFLKKALFLFCIMFTCFPCLRLLGIENLLILSKKIHQALTENNKQLLLKNETAFLSFAP